MRNDIPESFDLMPFNPVIPVNNIITQTSDHLSNNHKIHQYRVEGSNIRIKLIDPCKIPAENLYLFYGFQYRGENKAVFLRHKWPLSKSPRARRA